MQHSQQSGMLGKGFESVSVLQMQKRVIQDLPITRKHSLGINKIVYTHNLYTNNVVGINCVFMSAPIASPPGLWSEAERPAIAALRLASLKIGTDAATGY